MHNIIITERAKFYFMQTMKSEYPQLANQTCLPLSPTTALSHPPNPSAATPHPSLPPAAAVQGTWHTPTINYPA